VPSAPRSSRLHGTALNWFRSYLSSRCFRVKCNNDFSSQHTCFRAVLQNSVLGPLLFVMSTTSLISTLVSSLSINHHLYADDTQLFLSFYPSDFHSQHQSLIKCSTTDLFLDDCPSSHSQLFWNWLDLSNNSLKYRTALSLPTHSASNLGFIFDEHVTFSDQITALSKSSYYHIRELPIPWLQNNQHHCHLHSSVVVHSKRDYCNSIITFQTVNLTGSNRFKTLLLVVLLRLLNPLISLPFSNLSTG